MRYQTMKQLIINARETEKRYALLDNGKLVQFYTENPRDKSLVGNIYLALVENVIPSMNAAFVQLGKGIKGYLPLKTVQINPFIGQDGENNGPVKIKQGDKVIVQVIKDQTALKEYTVTGNIEFSGKGLVYMPYGKYVAVSKKLGDEERKFWKTWGFKNKSNTEGLLVRTFADTAGTNVLEKELEKLRQQYADVLQKAKREKAPALVLERDPFFEKIVALLEEESLDEVHCDSRSLLRNLEKVIDKTKISIQYFQGNENIFSNFHLDKSVHELHKKIVWLDNGANLVIEEAEAFTIIDVNSGKFTGSLEKNAATMEINRLASVEIARQLRLRNISGIVLIDFINMNHDKNREEIVKLMEREFANAEPRTTIHGFTTLGLMELSRKKTTPSVKQKTMIPCPVCHGVGNVPSPEACAFKLERELWELKGQDVEKVVVEVTEDIYSYFSGEYRPYLENLEEALHFQIEFQKIENLVPFYHIKRVLR